MRRRFFCLEHISLKKGNAQKNTVFVRECRPETAVKFLPAAVQKDGRSFQRSILVRGTALEVHDIAEKEPRIQKTVQ